MKPQNYFFLGIGGIGNSALAQYFLEQGSQVAGYDRTQSLITKKLEEKAIRVIYEFAPKALPDFLDRETTTIVCTAAIKTDQPWYRYFIKQGFTIEKRAKVLAQIANAQICVAVAGTHGKTTTLGLLTHIFKTAQWSFTAFVGGILEGYESNYIHTGDRYLLVEADEFDRSFLQLRPSFAAITSVDPDHLDIYDSPTAFEEAFEAFAEQVREVTVLGPEVALKGFRLGEAYQVKNTKIKAVGYRADFYLNSENALPVEVAVMGPHNLNNALMAAALAHEIGIPTQAIQKALASFQGIQRRMQVTEWQPGLYLVDDYAHHPTEIRAVYDTLHERYPETEKTVVFQPHLFSRTKDFFEDFTKVLALFDRVFVLPIYPAREEPIEGVTAQALLDDIQHTNKALIFKSQILPMMSRLTKGVIALLGAGDIGSMAAELKQKTL